MRKISTITLTLLCIAAFAQQKGTFTDTRDKKVYKTVKIGEQTWMAENLNYGSGPGLCYYSKPANCDKYGRRYGSEKISGEYVCPKGWHLPSLKEWNTLVDFAGGDKIAAKKLKAIDASHRGYGEDKYGFSALPGGCDGPSLPTWQKIEISGCWLTNEKDRKVMHIYFGPKDGDRMVSVDEVYTEKFPGSVSVRCVQGEPEEAAKQDSIAKIDSIAAFKAKVERVKKGSFTDSRDGKSYKTVKLDNQTWMAENLNYNAEGSKCSGENPDNCQKYGRLYYRKEALSDCPKGWHLPSNDEWQTLVDFAGGYRSAGRVLRAAAPAGTKVSEWGFENGDYGEDSFGFSILNNYEASVGWWTSSIFNDSAYSYNDINRIYYWRAEGTSMRKNSYPTSSIDKFAVYVRCVQGDAPKEAPAAKQAEPPKQTEQPKQAEKPAAKQAEKPKQATNEFCTITFPKKTCLEMPKGACKMAGGKVVDKCK